MLAAAVVFFFLNFDLRMDGGSTVVRALANPRVLRSMAREFVVSLLHLCFFLMSLSRVPTLFSRPGFALPRDDLPGTSAGAAALCSPGTVGFCFRGGMFFRRRPVRGQGDRCQM